MCEQSGHLQTFREMLFRKASLRKPLPDTVLGLLPDAAHGSVRPVKSAVKIFLSRFPSGKCCGSVYPKLFLYSNHFPAVLSEDSGRGLSAGPLSFPY